MDCQIIILAAGNGTRMDSVLPKVMHRVGNMPMLERVILNAREVTENIILVHSSLLIDYIEPYKNLCKFVLQPEPLGTAHAVHVARDLIEDDKYIAVIFGDNPFISASMIKQLLNYLHSTDAGVVTLGFHRNNPAQYGRIVNDKQGNFLKIVEFKEASEEEKKIQLCNSGIMFFNSGVLKKYLPYCLLSKVNDKSELYLTKIIAACREGGEGVSYFISQNPELVIGVNTQEELLEANNIIVRNEQ